MAEFFDPSPRASKRRKTATYNTGRSILEDRPNSRSPSTVLTQISGSTPTSAQKKVRSRANLQDLSPSLDRNGVAEDEAVPRMQGEDNVSKKTSQSSRGRKHGTSKSPYSTKSRPVSAQKVTNDVLTQATQYTSQAREEEEEGGGGGGGEGEGEEQDEEKDGDANDDGTEKRSSRRERRKPRRFSVSPKRSTQRKNQIDTSSQSATEAHPISPDKILTATPKGILTPSGRKRGRPRKSVVFDQTEKAIEEQFGFKDIDTSAGSSRKRKSKSLGQDYLEGGAEHSSPAISSKRKVKRGLVTTQGGDTGEPDLEDDDEDEDLLIQQIASNDVQPDSVRLGTDHSGEELAFDESPEFLDIKAEIVSRLVSPKSSTHELIPAYLQTQYDNLHNLITATVTTGESNSLLLLGSRGAGKSHMLNIALHDLDQRYGDDFHTVHLNGFFQTDDKLALREIWRQLGREMNIDETEIEGISSYADTMASLLSLLSHPDDFEDPTGVSDLSLAMDLDGDVVAASKTSKSIIFVLDEFDLFTTHPRQTLLYNLFDIAQSRKAPIAVIGCSTRMDVVECLEKRVKSRFSHRWLHVPSPKSVDGLEHILKTILTIDARSQDMMQKMKNNTEAANKWNTYIQTTFLPSNQVQDLIKRVFYTTKSIADLMMAMYLPIVALNISPTIIESGSALSDTACPPVNPPSLLELLSGLPTLHLALLVAAARLDTVFNLSSFNFNVVYDHYAELIARTKLQQTASGAIAVGGGLRQWTAGTAKRAWEELGAYGAIVPVTGKSASATGSNSATWVGIEAIGGEGANTRMWRVDVTLEDLVWALKEKSVMQSSHDGSGVSGMNAGAMEMLSKWCKAV